VEHRQLGGLDRHRRDFVRTLSQVISDINF
jgi:hypothetical protein